MNTKVAYLPRILPGLFHLPPTATPAGYRMPHERYFVYAAAFSALLHVAVLYGIRPNPIVRPPATPINLGSLTSDTWTPVEAELEPEKETVENKTEPEKTVDDANNASEERATLGETFRDISSDAIVVDLGRVASPVMPDSARIRWTVPSGPPTAAKAVRTKPFDPKDLDVVPAATSRIAPRYPSEMRRNGIEGVAVLRFIVDSRGEVAEVEVVRADTVEFGKAAAEAMLRWKFKPGMKNGRHVDTRMEMPMNFTMEKAT
jgi:protein TonB